MHEHEVRVSTVLTTVLWVVSFGLVVVGMVTNRNGIPGFGVLTGMAATTIHIRGFIASYEERMRGAFELGRDHERSLRSLR